MLCYLFSSESILPVCNKHYHKNNKKVKKGEEFGEIAENSGYVWKSFITVLQVCVKLECCPYIVSTLQVTDSCPENCQHMTKTKYSKAATATLSTHIYHIL